MNNKILNNIPEYISPEKKGVHTVLLQETVARYNFALPYIRGSCLDIACGSGIGTFLASVKASDITGVDSNYEALDYAGKTFLKENIKFKNSDFFEFLSSSQINFDTIICYETLEHLNNISEAIKLLSCKLNKYGILICSIPLNDIQNPHHKHLFGSATDIIELFSIFPFCQYHLQHNLNFFPHDPATEVPERCYFIVLASFQNVLQRRFTTLQDYLNFNSTNSTYVK